MGVGFAAFSWPKDSQNSSTRKTEQLLNGLEKSNNSNYYS